MGGRNDDDDDGRNRIDRTIATAVFVLCFSCPPAAQMSLFRTAAQRAVSSSRSAAFPAASPAVRAFASSSRVRSTVDPQLGDYPDVPAVSRQRRKYDKKYWDPQEKANFGETVRGVVAGIRMNLRACVLTNVPTLSHFV